MPGFKSERREIVLKGPQSQSLDVTLSPATGRLSLFTDAPSFEGILVALDGRDLALTPAEAARQTLPPRDMAVGQHTMTCKQGASRPFSASFQIRENETALVSCRLSGPPTKAWRGWPWVAVGGGAVAVASGAALVASYYSDKRKADDENLQMESNKHIVGWPLIGVGAAGIGTGLYLYFSREDEKPKKTSFTVLPGGVAFTY
jgi:hypothetical protein